MSIHNLSDWITDKEERRDQAPTSCGTARPTKEDPSACGMPGMSEDGSVEQPEKKQDVDEEASSSCSSCSAGMESGSSCSAGMKPGSSCTASE